MLNVADSNAWKAKVKAIFEAKKALKEAELEGPKMDLGADTAEDPETAPPVGDGVPPEGSDDTMGVDDVEEEEPTITLTANCLLALLEYFDASDTDPEDGSDDELGIDDDATGESIEGSQPEASAMAAGGMGVGFGEATEEPEGVAVDSTENGEGGDDVIGSQDTLTDTPPESSDSEEKTPEQVVQALIDASADHEGPLDVDVLSTVFAAPEEGGEELGDGSDLATNTEEIPGEDDQTSPLPATTGKQTLPLAEDSSNVSHSGELERKHKALAALEARLKSVSDESDKADVREDIAAVKSQIAKLKTKSITSAQGHKNAASAKATHKDDAEA